MECSILGVKKTDLACNTTLNSKTNDVGINRQIKLD